LPSHITGVPEMKDDTSYWWKPMQTAPSDGTWILVKNKRMNVHMVVQWDSDQLRWWLPEGALLQSEDFIGWYPIPQ
jgi:hypothetical protein